MKVTLLPSSMTSGGVDQHQYLTTFLINDTLAIDAGSIGFFGSPAQQANILDVLISHTHSDHVASLPIFIENAFEGRPVPVTIHGSRTVLDSIRQDIFNGRIWPDFITMSMTTGPLFLKTNEIESGQTIELQGLQITPVSVDHLVPTLGFVIDDGVDCVVIASDTGPTEEIWKVAHSTTRLRAVYLETAFPNSMTELAKISKHLTPAMFGEEARKLNRNDIDLIVVHIKPRFYDTIVQELQALGLPNIKIGRFNETYDF